MNKYLIKVYVDHGIYQYEVAGLGSATEHAQVITKSRTYRRIRKDGSMEFFTPLKVKVTPIGDSPKIESQYMDEFIKT